MTKSHNAKFEKRSSLYVKYFEKVKVSISLKFLTVNYSDREPSATPHEEVILCHF